MSIYVTGDCHADFHRFNRDSFPIQKELTKEDFVIITGDFGAYWDTSAELMWWRRWLSDRPFRTLFLDGNHENFTMLHALPVTEWKGGKVHCLPGTDILHLMRGQMYDIDGCKIFTFGGAKSHDISEGIIPYDEHWKETAKSWTKMGKRFFRIDQVSWWKEEMPSEEEMAEGLATLEAAGWQCDYILSHDCPSSDLATLFQGNEEPYRLNEYLEEIRNKTNYKRWFFGHHHNDLVVNDKDILLYYSILRIW